MNSTDVLQVNRESWKKSVINKYPNAVFQSTGVYIWATIDGKDVGLFSIIGNYGKIF